MGEKISKEKINKKILDMWSKEALADNWINEHIKYNELKEKINLAIGCIEEYKELTGIQVGITANLINNLLWILEGNNEYNK